MGARGQERQVEHHARRHITLREALEHTVDHRERLQFHIHFDLAVSGEDGARRTGAIRCYSPIHEPRKSLSCSNCSKVPAGRLKRLPANAMNSTDGSVGRLAVFKGGASPRAARY